MGNGTQLTVTQIDMRWCLGSKLSGGGGRV